MDGEVAADAAWGVRPSCSWNGPLLRWEVLQCVQIMSQLGHKLFGQNIQDHLFTVSCAKFRSKFR